jgi:hypothetical protein
MPKMRGEGWFHSPIVILQPRIPRTGCARQTKSIDGATGVSGNAILHELRVSDASWIVDRGKTCR